MIWTEIDSNVEREEDIYRVVWKERDEEIAWQRKRSERREGREGQGESERVSVVYTIIPLVLTAIVYS